MFNIASIIPLLFVVGPMVALTCYLNLTCETFDTLPHRRGLMNLPGYAFLYGRCEGDTDLPDRSVKKTLLWLAGLYVSVLASLAPVANKFLGMFAWLLTNPMEQIALVTFFDLCILSIGYFGIKTLRRVRACSGEKFRYLPLIALGIVLGVSAFCAMASSVQFVVAHFCKTTASGIFIFLFSGALLFTLNEKPAETGAGELGSRLVFVFLALLSVSALASIVM